MNGNFLNGSSEPMVIVSNYPKYNGALVFPSASILHYTHTMSYTTLRHLMLSFLALYALIGLVTKHKLEKDTYPFFSWSLFSDVPNTIVEYTIAVTEKDGLPISPHMLFKKENTTQIFTKKHSALYYFDTIQRLGAAIVENNGETIAKERKLLEEDLLPETSYGVVRIRYNPLDYFRDGKLEYLESLAKFTKGSEL